MQWEKGYVLCMYKTERFSESSILKVCFRENEHRVKVEVLNCCQSTFDLPVIQIHVLPALYPKLDLCFPRKNCAASFPIPTFMYLWTIYCIYSQDRSAHKVPTYVQSCAWRLPKYWPPTPSPPRECVLPPHQRRGVHTCRAVRGWGGQYFRRRQS
jgi:hypothetical protein